MQLRIPVDRPVLAGDRHLSGLGRRGNTRVYTYRHSGATAAAAGHLRRAKKIPPLEECICLPQHRQNSCAALVRMEACEHAYGSSSGLWLRLPDLLLWSRMMLRLQKECKPYPLEYKLFLYYYLG